MLTGMRHAARCVEDAAPTRSASLLAEQRDREAWVARRRADVHAAALAFATRVAVSPEQRDLLRAVVSGAQAGTTPGRFSDLAPLLSLFVTAAVRGSDAPAFPLAAALSLLDLGIHLIDDLTDGDLPARWHGYAGGLVSLAASGMIAALPQLLLTELDATPATQMAMLRTLATGLLAVGAGQQRDLELAGADASAAEFESCAEAKSGMRMATYCAMAAQFAGADDVAAAQFAAYGRALGTAAQLHSEWYDLFAAPRSADLARGARTLPLALYLHALDARSRAAFQDRLASARGDVEAQSAIRQALRAAGVQYQSALVIEIYCARARRALMRVESKEPGRGALQALIDDYSFRHRGAAR